MIYKWENEKDRLIRFMKVSAKRRMEWLYQMHKFTRLAYSAKQREIFWKLRGIR